MYVFVAVAVLLTVLTVTAFTSTTSISSADGFVESGPVPACPADLFDSALVTATCYQDWDRRGRWFVRLISSGIPAHAYGQREQPWDHLVMEQQWDITIPIISDEDGIDALSSLQRDVEPAEFLVGAAREDRPIGMALNGVPFFSPLTPTGADTVNPLPGQVAENETLFDECAGSLQASTGAYGYRVMPPCLFGGPSSSVLEAGGYEPSNALVGFKGDGLDGSLSQPPESPLLGLALDGRRIYGPYDSTGTLAEGLDVCNGRWEQQANDTDDGNTETYAYTYRASPSFPYLIGCWGPAGTSLDAALEATATAGIVSERGDYVYSEIDGGFLLEVPDDGCPAGSFLHTETQECEACPAGTYGKDAGLAGLTCPGVCPVGYYCPDGTAMPTLKCPAGTFGAMPGMEHESCSGECQQGFFCLPGSVAPDSNECGSIMFFCPKGSGQRTPVSSGFYTINVPPEGSLILADADHSTTAAVRVRSGEAQCESGTYCVAGRRRSCPAGTFGATPGLISPTCSGVCPAGNYCPERSVEPIPCPAGTYGGEEGLSTQDCSGLCAQGHYCPAGSVSAFQYACPAGTFGEAYGLTDGLCAEEHVCAREENVPCVASMCDPGYYCPPGSISARENTCGSGDLFCPRGSAFPTPVDSGHYTYVDNAVDGGIGDFWSLEGQTTRTAQAECEPGFYCTGGARVPCPVGTIGSSAGLTSPSCSGPCPAGYFCGVSAIEGERCGGPRWYCPEGSSHRLEVGAGNYSVEGPPDRRAAQAVCPTGTYCQEGVSIPCPAGTYGDAPGLFSPVCSGACPAGRYCLSGTPVPSASASIAAVDDVGLACPPGRYGVEGMGDAMCTGPCPKGYYCPAGSVSGLAYGSGYYCPEGSAERKNVTVGWFATGGGGEWTRSGQVECPAASGEGGGGSTPPSGKSIVERCPDNTVGWDGVALN
eukprot:g12590.t1